VLWGGLPAFASYVGALRDLYPGRVVVVDSGDMWQGTLESNLFEGEAMVRAYNVIGYAAAAVGNHEFDFGPVGSDAIAHKPGDDALGAVKRNADLAMFPLLSANMIEKSNLQTPKWAKGHTIVRAGGARIGIIGLSTPDTPNVTMAANVVSLQFTDPVQATVRAARELREQGADAVIVIAHMGGRCTDLSNPHDTSSCPPHHEAMDLLGKLPAGTVDAYFGGHTHAQIRHYVNGVPAVQAGPFSGEFSTIDLWVDPAANKVVKSDIRPHTPICTFVYEGTDACNPRSAPKGARLVPRIFNGETIAADTRVATTVEPYLRRVAAKREEKVGIRTAAPFSRTFSGESPLGDLIADALREFASTDIAFMNSGGIRGIMQVSGLRYTVDAARDNDKEPKQRNRIVSVTLPDGAPIEPGKLYTVAMPDFIAAGGDSTQDVMSQIPRERIRISYARPIRDVLVEVLSKRQQPLEPRVEGRITVLNLPEAAS